MAGEEALELKFRLFDGTDIGPDNYAPGVSVAALKERIIEQWPPDKGNAPQSISDITLINAGKILDNSKTLGESRVPVSELSGGVITMLVVVKPPFIHKQGERERERYVCFAVEPLGSPKKPRCGCTIL